MQNLQYDSLHSSGDHNFIFLGLFIDIGILSIEIVILKTAIFLSPHYLDPIVFHLIYQKYGSLPISY